MASPTTTPPHRGDALQAGGRVDHVAGDHSLGPPGRRQRDKRLPGGDANPYRQAARSGGLVQLLDGLQDAQAGPDGPLRVVLVGDRRAEHRHHRVADELLDGAPEPLDLGPNRAEVIGATGPGRPRDRPGPTGGEPDQVAEQHRDDLALLAGRGPWPGGRPPQRPQNRTPSELERLAMWTSGMGRVYGEAAAAIAPS